MNSTKLEMKSISIEFPGVIALRNVSFATETGVSHALVGANGAGKSTLMKVLSGAYSHYSGSISINGEEVRIRSPRDAKRLGIEVVYQEVDTALIPYLSVAENIMLDIMVNDMKRKQLVRWSSVHAEARKVLDLLKVGLDTKKITSQLTLAQKQMVLIARAIAKECRFLVLDEPTAPLSHSETEELFRVVRDILARNIGVIFISHRLPELFEICSRITILRDGECVETCSMEQVSMNRIVELMLGKRFDENYPKYRAAIGEKSFEVRSLTDGAKLKGIDLHVRSGEIVGVAGLVGAGKSELCKALFGANAVRYAEAKIRGKPYRIRDPHASVAQGVALVPEERRKEGILVGESVSTNLTAASLGDFSRGPGFIDFAAERRTVRKMIENLAIKTPGEQQKVGFLSGGNQQKVAVGKWLIADADVYIFDEPTKGVDVGAKKDIFDLIGRLAMDGKAVVYASCELAEIMGITDRVYVMYNGMIVKELKTDETNEEELLFYSTGGT